jgi:hypothetical protein
MACEPSHATCFGFAIDAPKSLREAFEVAGAIVVVFSQMATGAPLQIRLAVFQRDTHRLVERFPNERGRHCFEEYAYTLWCFEGTGSERRGFTNCTRRAGLAKTPV